MNDELIETISKFSEPSFKRRIKTIGNSKMLLLINNTLVQVTPSTLRSISNSAETEKLINSYKDIKENEFILIAYYEGKIAGYCTTII